MKWKNCRWCHHQRISKRNVKQVISPLGGHSWGLYGYQKKQKSSRKLNLFVWCSTFQSKLNKHWKTTIKSSFLKGFCLFLVVFRSLFNFDWKVEHHSKKIKFYTLLCFFWHPSCPQGRPPRGLNEMNKKTPSVISPHLLTRKNSFTLQVLKMWFVCGWE